MPSFKIVVAVLVLTGSAASAKDQPVPPSARLNAITACQSIGDDAQRLACYDREAATLIKSAQAGEIRVIDREDVRVVRRSLFGFSLPKLGLFGGDGEETADEMESTIKSVQEMPNGRYRMVIAEGDAVWETTETPMRFNEPRPGEKIVIKRGAVGSYFLRVGRQLGVKGRRIS